MSALLVQKSAVVATTSSGTVTLPASSTTGNTLILVLSVAAGVTPSVPSNYILAVSNTVIAAPVFIYYCSNAPNTSSVTVSQNSSNTMYLMVLEYSGISSLGQTATANSGGASGTVITSTTSLLIAALSSTGTSTPNAATGGWTVEGSSSDATGPGSGPVTTEAAPRSFSAGDGGSGTTTQSFVVVDRANATSGSYQYTDTSQTGGAIASFGITLAVGYLNLAGAETGTYDEAISHSGAGANGATSSVVSSPVNSGSYAYHVVTGGSYPAYFQFGAINADSTHTTTSQTDFYVRTWIQFGTIPQGGSSPIDEDFLTILDNTGALKCSFAITSSGAIAFYPSSRTGAMVSSTYVATGTWVRIECHIGTGSSAAFETKVNGTSILSGSFNGTTNCGSVLLGTQRSSPNQFEAYYDDFALRGDVYPGNGFCRLVVPTGSGSSAAWTPDCSNGPGSAPADWACVNDIPYRGSNSVGAAWVDTSTSGAVSTYSIAGANTTITGNPAAVKVVAYFLSSNAIAGCTIRLLSGTTNSDTAGTNFPITSTANNTGLLQSLRASDPNTSAAWTVSGVSSAQIGTINNATGSTQVQLQAIGLMADFVPPATRNHTTDYAVRSTYTRSHTADYKVRGTSVRSHTTNYNTRSTNTRAHATNYATRYTSTKPHTTDYGVRSTSLRTHTTDYIVRSTSARTHTTDYRVRSASFRSYTTDYVVRSTITRINTTDYAVRSTSTKPHSTDYVVRSTSTKQHTTDYVVRSTLTKPHSTDYTVRSTSTKQHTTDYVVRSTITRTYTADYTVRSTSTKQHTADYTVRSTSTRACTTDYTVRSTSTKQHTADYRVRSTSLRIHTTDYTVRSTSTKPHSTDYSIWLVSGRSHNTDVGVKAFGVTKRQSVDSSFLGLGTLRSYNTDAALLRTTLLSYSTDAKTGSSSVGSRARTQRVGTRSTSFGDGEMKERQQSTTNYPIAVLLVLSSDHVTGTPNVIPTITISKNGANWINPYGSLSYDSSVSAGWFLWAPAAGDRDTLGELRIHVTAPGCDPYDEKYEIVAYDPFSGAHTQTERNAIADSILVRDWTAITMAAASRSLLNAVRFLRNKWTLSTSGTLTIMREDDITPAWTGQTTGQTNTDPITGNTPTN